MVKGFYNRSWSSSPIIHLPHMSFPHSGCPHSLHPVCAVLHGVLLAVMVPTCTITRVVLNILYIPSVDMDELISCSLCLLPVSMINSQ